MNKLFVQNLCLIVTERCNLNCAHCMRGKCSNKVMADKVIEATLGQFYHIQNLSICGGEITMALDTLEKIFSYVIDNNIIVEMVTMVINVTIYSDDFLKMLDYMSSYINNKKMKELSANFVISKDMYHFNEIERLGKVREYFENVEKYKNSKHFNGFQELQGQLFREGNAENLDLTLTVPMIPMTPQVTYIGEFNKFDMENGTCNIGPLVCVNFDGTITECDASIFHQNSIYNYGNVLSDSIEEVTLKRGNLILKPRKWFIATKNEINKYQK